MPSQLKPYLDRIGKKFSQNWFKIRDIEDWMELEIHRKRKTFPYWRKKVLFTYTSWKKNHSKSVKSQKEINITTFFYHKFNWLFQYYIKKLFSPYEASQLEFIGAIGNLHQENTDILFEYKYHLTEKEYKLYTNFQKDYKIPDTPDKIITNIMNIATMVFNKLISEITKISFSITMISASVNDVGENKKNLHFLISCRDLELKFYLKYLYTLIYHFAEILPQIDQKLLTRLRIQNQQIFPLAMQEYKKARQTLTTTFYTLELKTQIIQHLTPLLDIMNFICARVEDSVYDTQHLVKNILKKSVLFPNNHQIIQNYMDIFNFVNNAASLFSTFQSNNRANLRNQYLLFFFYIQHFCAGGIHSMEENISFYFPEIITERLKRTKEKQEPLFDNIFQIFIFQGMELPQMADPALDLVFQSIFGSNVYSLNEGFFESFLFSFTQMLYKKIRDYNQQEINPSMDFNQFAHIMCVILMNLVDNVFLENTPKMAQKHFKDRLMRYAPEKIALRVLELKIFKEIPLSDNNWQDYFLSRNSDKVRRVFRNHYDIPDNYFFSHERLLKINMVYERGLSETTPYLEDWLFNSILIPFHNFQVKINALIKSKFIDFPSIEQISPEIFSIISKGVIDSSIRSRLEKFADFLARIWIFE